MELRESRARLHRYIEEVNEARERASVLREEIINSATDVMNQRMYVRSLVTAIFLPLGFLTELLGINVGDNPFAFIIFLGILMTSTALILWIFKIKRWL
ncbi:CorA family divalent cation transporter [Neptunomonas japonica]|uniref:CorA family divalent cation transporter n=1 Tax=Neptunomonas japonica TaxID=417574 RepID=UPI001915E8D8|nr:CorA family divalent cation transporter [Neptunomonas japonica]